MTLYNTEGQLSGHIAAKVDEVAVVSTAAGKRLLRSEGSRGRAPLPGNHRPQASDPLTSPLSTFDLALSDF